MTRAAAGSPGARLFGVMLAAVLVPLNSTMIAVALPEIASDLGVSKGTTGVLVLVYLVVMLVGQPTAGRLGDAVGSRRMLLIGLVGVGVASLVAAFVGSFSALVAARTVQAVFAAMLVPNVQSLMRASTTPASRGRVFGFLGSLLGTGAALGPLVGGVVIAAAGWQAVFWVNIPVVVASLVLQRRPLEATAAGPAESASAPVSSDRILNRVFGGSFGAQAATTFGQYTLILVVPLVLDERGWSPGAIGLVVTALTAGMVVMGPPGGRIGDLRGRRLPATSGFAVAAASLLVLAVAGAGVAGALLVVALAAFGLGFGFAAPSVMTAAIESVAEERTGAASGVFAMSRYAGSIPASLAFALLTGTGTEGVDVLLVAAAVIAVGAVVAATLLPGPTGVTVTVDK